MRGRDFVGLCNIQGIHTFDIIFVDHCFPVIVFWRVLSLAVLKEDKLLPISVVLLSLEYTFSARYFKCLIGAWISSKCLLLRSLCLADTVEPVIGRLSVPDHSSVWQQAVGRLSVSLVTSAQRFSQGDHLCWLPPSRPGQNKYEYQRLLSFISALFLQP